MPAPASSHRLFTAVWPTAAARDALLDHAARWHWPAGTRRTQPERIHVTLQFIGNWPGDRVDELSAALASVRFAPFALLLDSPEVWRGGIAVMAASQVPAALAQLHADIGAKLAATGVQLEDRPLRAHATLARDARGARPPAEAAAIEWPAQDGFSLVRSLPGGRGYESLQRFG